MHDLAKLLLDGKTLCVMPEKQLRKMNVKLTEVDIQFGYDMADPVLHCFVSSPNNKLYILPDEYEKIPLDLCKMLSIKDIRPVSSNDLKHSRRIRLITFRSVCDLQRYSINLMTPSLIKMECKKGRWYRVNVWIKDIERQLSGYCNASNDGLLLMLSDFNNLPLSIQFQFELKSAGNGNFSVLAIHSSHGKSDYAHARNVSSKNGRLHKKGNQLVRQTSNDHTASQHIHQYEGKVVITDDSILPRCNKVTLLLGKNSCLVTGFISKASGSLLVPASHFIKEIPEDKRDLVDWADPAGNLRKYEPLDTGVNVDWSTLKMQSLLYRSGYSVKSGISKETRQKILSSLILEELLSKEDIVRHIKNLMVRNKRYPSACVRWQEDIDYVLQL